MERIQKSRTTKTKKNYFRLMMRTNDGRRVKLFLPDVVLLVCPKHMKWVAPI